MALSNAEKQRRYRERAMKDPDGLLLTRLQVMISAHAAETLERLCQTSGETKREIVERAILQFDGNAVTKQQNDGMATEKPQDDGNAVTVIIKGLPERLPDALEGKADDGGDESRLYEEGSGVSAFVLAMRAAHAIAQMSRKDPNALAGAESIRLALEKQLQAWVKPKRRKVRA